MGEFFAKLFNYGMKIGVLLMMLGCIIHFQSTPDTFMYALTEKIIMAELSKSGASSKPPGTVKFNVYLFHVTNPEEVNMGKVPELKEVGPYVYSEVKEIYDVVINEQNGTASYFQKTIFQFNQKASGDLKDTDAVTIFNAPAMGVLGYADKNMNEIMGLVPWGDVFTGATDLFLRSLVKNILFDGVTIMDCNGVSSSKICNETMLHSSSTITKGPNNTLIFSLFNHLNNTYDGRYEVKLGWNTNRENPLVEDAKLLGKILKWENVTTAKNWSGMKCNQITRPGATKFSSSLTKDSRIDILSTELCRSLPMHYDRDSSYKGIDSMRFTAQEMLPGGIKANSCLPGDDCSFKEALDITPQGTPSTLTYPHFYKASDEYLRMINGLQPSKELHETFLEIEPKTGILLSGGEKKQFNVVMKKIEKVSLTKNVRTALFPIAWVNEGVNMNDDIANDLKNQLSDNLSTRTAATWGTIGVGIVLFTIGMVIYLCDNYSE